MKLVEFMVSVLIMLAVFSALFFPYSSMASDAREKAKQLNRSLSVGRTCSLIESLRIFGAPFEYAGAMSREYHDVVAALEGVAFNRFTGRYEYMTCRRW